jgi:plasmid stabilization system protein ParE
LDDEAVDEASEAAAYIARESPHYADLWFAGLEKAIASLEHFPNRCGMAPESAFLNKPLRHHIYKSYRIIFRVEEKERVVRILHVRHARRRALGEPGDEM